MWATPGGWDGFRKAILSGKYASKFTSLTVTGLTATRIPIVGIGGLLGDDADLTFSVDTLTVTGLKFTNAYSNNALAANGIGNTALQNNTGVGANGFGQSALLNNTGTYSSGVGASALQENIGDYSNGFGYTALAYNTGPYSQGFGHGVLKWNVGTHSLAVGVDALILNNWPNAIMFGNASSHYFAPNSATDQAFAYADIDATAHTITFAGAHGFGTTGAKVNLKFTKTAGATAPTGLVDGEVYQFTITSSTVLTLVEITSQGSADFTGKLTNSLDISNSIAIGNDVNNTKSNQVILGPSGITETLLQGYVGIDTDAPGGPLDVRGDLSLFGSTRGQAYILSNQLNFQYNSDSETGGWINLHGYIAGDTQFRSLYIGDGKGAAMAFFQGSTGNVGTNTLIPRYKNTTVGIISALLSDDGTNYEGLTITPASGTVTLAAVTAGTGSDNIDLVLNPAGTGLLKIGTAAAAAVAVASTHKIAVKDGNGDTYYLLATNVA